MAGRFVSPDAPRRFRGVAGFIIERSRPEKDICPDARETSRSYERFPRHVERRHSRMRMRTFRGKGASSTASHLTMPRSQGTESNEAAVTIE